MSRKDNSFKIGIITLLASSSTLICCALPALFILMGAGATLATLVDFFPQLILISKYKVYITVSTAIILMAAGILLRKSPLLPCPTDPVLRETCLIIRKKSKIIYVVSVGIFFFASFFTYILPIYL